MWAPKPGLKGDPQGPDDFTVSQLRSILRASDVHVYRKNGKVVEAKELPLVLPKDTHVLWSERKIDPYYLTVMRDDVLIVVVEFEKIIKASSQSTPPATAPSVTK